MNRIIISFFVGAFVFLANCNESTREMLSPVDDDGSMGRKSSGREVAGSSGTSGQGGFAGSDVARN